MKTNPPKWADRFLRWYCKPELLEEIQGDIYEIFERTVSEGDSSHAKRIFIWDVLRFFRWSNIKRSKSITHNNNIAMITNYLKTGVRNIVKDKMTSTINILGLSIAIGCAITSYLFGDYMLHQDSYHSNKENIYQLINVVDNNDDRELWSDAPIVLADELKNQISFVDKVVRVEHSSGNMRYEDLVFNEFLWFADPEILEMFDFPIAQGSKKVLYDKEKIFVSRNVAVKYFGDTDAIGKQISIKHDNEVIQSYFIGGVFDEWPARTSFAPNVLIPLDNFYSLRPNKLYDWSYLTDGIFISLNKGHAITELYDYVPSWVILQNDSDPEFKTTDFEPISLLELPSRNYEISSALIGGGHPAGVIGLGVISLFLVLLACFNYVNIAVSSSVKRLKEIALRKVMGGSRNGIIRQFLIENIITCLLALLFGLALAYFFLLPGFNALIPIEIPFEFSSVLPASIFFVALVLFLGLLSGAYPAFYISRFNPVSIFRGSQKFGRKGIFSKILLTLQFVLAFSTVVGSFIFTDASIQLTNRDWGYEPGGVISIPVTNSEQLVGIRDLLAQNPDVVDIAGSYGQIWAYDRVTTINVGEEVVQTNMYGVASNYASLLDFEIRQGRFIQSESDAGKAVVNQRMVDNMNWENPLEEHFYFDSVRYDVVGVIQNLINRSPFEKPLPAFFTAMEEDSFNYLSVKSSSGNESNVYEASKEAWKQIAPDDPFEGFYQSEVMDNFYQENQANVTIMLFVSGFALLLSCIGLYGLVSFNINRRMKEFSIRKVLGANMTNISKLVNSDYIWIVLIAFLVGAPLGYVQVVQLLNSIYPETPELTNMPYLVALIVIIGSLVLTIASQIHKISKSNPADKLRSQ